MLPVANPDVIFQSLSDGAVLFSTRDEVYFGMNDVAARVWEALPAHATWEDLFAAVEAHYPDAEAQTLRRDVRQLIDDLLAQHLLLPRAET